MNSLLLLYCTGSNGDICSSLLALAFKVDTVEQWLERSLNPSHYVCDLVHKERLLVRM